MLSISPTEEFIEFHGQVASTILDKIINEKIGKNLLLDSTRNFIKRYKNILIKAEPRVLLKVHEKFNSMKNGQDFESLKLCFNERAYKSQFQKKHSKEFLEILGIDTCVYCNRNYTIQIVENRARAELDHWFPKEIFPLLSLSLYNLIPSCHSCNHIKHNNTPDGGWANALTNLIHPYLGTKDDYFLFSYYYDSINVPRTITRSNSIKARKTIEFIKIDKIYDSHSNRELKDLLDLRYKYSKNYLDILVNKTFNHINISHDEVYRMVFGVTFNEKDFHQRPFSSSW